MGWFSGQRPGGDAAGAWVEESLRWLRGEFGDDPLGAPVLLPTTDDVPGEFTGGEEVAHDLCDRLCERMAVDPDRVTVVVTPLADDGVVGIGFDRNGGCAYHRDVHPQVVEVNPRLLTTPVSLVASIAHSLAHVRLLGEERVSTTRRDHEGLADLLSVYFGLGIFAANASFEPAGRAPSRGLHLFSRIGQLPEPVFGYALACYAWLRGEPSPEWSGFVDHGARRALADGLDYLAGQAEPGRLPEPQRK